MDLASCFQMVIFCLQVLHRRLKHQQIKALNCISTRPQCGSHLCKLQVDRLLNEDTYSRQHKPACFSWFLGAAPADVRSLRPLVEYLLVLSLSTKALSVALILRYPQCLPLLYFPWSWKGQSENLLSHNGAMWWSRCLCTYTEEVAEAEVLRESSWPSPPSPPSWGIFGELGAEESGVAISSMSE